jgi:hypothetical protein
MFKPDGETKSKITDKVVEMYVGAFLESFYQKINNGGVVKHIMEHAESKPVIKNVVSRRYELKHTIYNNNPRKSIPSAIMNLTFDILED